ncbi:MAG: hypothetical protein ACSHW4_03870 [Cellulophaga sp.]
MIKELIKDITFDKIDLNQALTRAKLIAYEIKNEDFKNWIAKELNGYEPNEKLPDYRILPCDVFAVLEAYGARKMVPVDLTDIDKNLNGKIYNMEYIPSISSIENSLKGSDEPYGYDEFPMQVVSLVRDMMNNKFIVSVKRRIQVSQLSHILNITKQRLIDTLLELDSAFPNMENNYQDTTENSEKASTIINNHIYGDNANSNVAVGDNLNQNITSAYNQKIEQILSDLGELGVPSEDIAEVKDLVTKETDKISLGKKLMTWVGKTTAKAIDKGIELQVPMILEKIQELM